MTKNALITHTFPASRVLAFCALSDSGDINHARLLFSQLQNPNTYIWNTMIRGCSRAKTGQIGFLFFCQMVQKGVEMDCRSFVFAFKACEHHRVMPETAFGAKCLSLVYAIANRQSTVICGIANFILKNVGYLKARTLRMFTFKRIRWLVEASVTLDISNNFLFCSGSSDDLNVPDFLISDMIIASLPFDGRTVVNEFTDANPSPDYKGAGPSMFDLAEECMILPFLEETTKVSYSDDMKSCEEAMIDSGNSSLHLAINQIRSCDQESDLNIDSDQAEDFDQFVIKNLPELSDVVSNFQPSIHPKESCRRKSITLVLDLDYIVEFDPSTLNTILKIISRSQDIAMKHLSTQHWNIAMMQTSPLLCFSI
ncbi:hypothetical protein DKX38_001599 [Salix brachista]|uniref:Pentatricopeptide repeat-containing protein n=1 Tax=Salix brachista TaxID=2182728 RepID=A0A5N5P3T7_9ROSI|nr:hypothetical protein DKX38_001599 [Salix brachista]